MFQLAAIETGHIIIGVVTLMATLFIAYYVARMMKGKVEIEIPKAGYNSGEEIVGKVTFTSRKNLHMNRFYVALIGYEIVERRDSGRRDRLEVGEVGIQRQVTVIGNQILLREALRVAQLT